MKVGVILKGKSKSSSGSAVFLAIVVILSKIV